MSATPPEGRFRARDLGIVLGTLPPGALNAITDVPGVRVGQTTLIAGDGPLVVGEGPVRTGVTAIVPGGAEAATEPVFAGSHVLNGNGEMTGLAWIEEAGLLSSPIAITNTHSVGVVRDAMIAHEVARGRHREVSWSLPVVAETWDGGLNDINGFHVRPEHLHAALDTATGGPVAEGGVGGGTGMVCHGFKGGIGTASRVVTSEGDRWTVGVLVQANYGQRHQLRIDGVPVGREISATDVPTPWSGGAMPPPGSGSIIVVIATDAPLLPHQCQRLAQRATIGIARVGGVGEDSSGDLFLAFSTANRGLEPQSLAPVAVRMLPSPAMSPLFAAAAEATEEAIVNALCVATTMVGVDGRTAHALPHDLLRQAMARYGRRGD
jgi:D-aminopeptidase